MTLPRNIALHPAAESARARYSFSAGPVVAIQAESKSDRRGRGEERDAGRSLQIDPSNAGAEYVLGELANRISSGMRRSQHFSRAAKLDASFGDAYVGLGGSLGSAKRFSDAISPLETAVKLQPGNPAAHYLLAIAYTRTGRKEDGDARVCHSTRS